MEELSIINNENTKQISNRLQHAVNSEYADELVALSDEGHDNMLKIAIKSQNAKPIICGIISDEIINTHEHFIIKSIIDKYEFSDTEKSEVFQNSLRHIPQNANRKNIINHHLLAYLANNDKIILDGFINFRLQEYKRELETVVQKGVDDFFVEKEYREFINLLRYFVEIQAPKEEIVHVVVDKNNHHEIYNAKRRNITQECRDEFMPADTELSHEIGLINYDDLLVSALITLSPEKLYFHGFENLHNKELALTIQNVFLKRLIVCNGCSFCLGEK